MISRKTSHSPSISNSEGKISVTLAHNRWQFSSETWLGIYQGNGHYFLLLIAWRGGKGFWLCRNKIYLIPHYRFVIFLWPTPPPNFPYLSLSTLLATTGPPHPLSMTTVWFHETSPPPSSWLVSNIALPEETWVPQTVCIETKMAGACLLSFAMSCSLCKF